MIACPSCGESAAVSIEQAPAAPASGPVADARSWAARCGGCGTDWSFAD